MPLGVSVSENTKPTKQLQ